MQMIHERCITKVSRSKQMGFNQSSFVSSAAVYYAYTGHDFGIFSLRSYASYCETYGRWVKAGCLNMRALLNSLSLNQFLNVLRQTTVHSGDYLGAVKNTWAKAPQ